MVDDIFIESPFFSISHEKVQELSKHIFFIIQNYA